MLTQPALGNTIAGRAMIIVTMMIIVTTMVNVSMMVIVTMMIMSNDGGHCENVNKKSGRLSTNKSPLFYCQHPTCP